MAAAAAAVAAAESQTATTSRSTKLKYIALVSVFAVGAIATIVLIFVFANSPSPPPPIEPVLPSQRADCLFDAASNRNIRIDRATCEQRGCVFADAESEKEEVERIAAPVCHFPVKSQRFGFDCVQADGQQRLWLRSRGSRLFGGDLEQLVVSADEVSDATLRVRITDPESTRYEVPIALSLPQTATLRPRYEFTFTRDPFTFTVMRRATRQVIFRSDAASFMFADQLIQIATELPTNKIMGIGENVKGKLLIPADRYRTWPLFARDEPVFNEMRNQYGVHPFYLGLEPDNSAYGVFILNSNAMEFITTPGQRLIYRTTGGMLDIFFFMGPDPETVTAQYHALIGKPMLPPYWSLGFHISRYGYRTLQQLDSTLERNLQIGLPLDAFHLDIDHMRDRMAFTVDPVNYPNLREYLMRRRRENHLRNIMIVNPVIITNVSNYRPYELGRQLDVFVRWKSPAVMPPGDFDFVNDTLMLGYVWPPGRAALIDFFKQSASDYWAQLMAHHHENVLPFDGVWIDMNEPANFGTNEEKPWNWPEMERPYWSLKCNSSSKYEMPPYRPSAAYKWDTDTKTAQLSDKTFCMEAVHTVSSDAGRQHMHYNLHSLYGQASELATDAALRRMLANRGSRSIIISRSNFPGSGAKVGTWLGDNDSSEQQLRRATIGMLEFNAFGIPYVGADICGFFNDASPELCTAWMQVGAFYPFSRNHNFRESADQDPAAYLSRCPSCVRKMVTAIQQRYRFNPHLYTLFHRVHRHGGTVVRPLFFNYPEETKLHAVDQSFMWGDSLLISPHTDLSSKSIKFWLPRGMWYDIGDSSDISAISSPANDASAWGFRRLWRLQEAEEQVDSVDRQLPLLHLRAGACVFTAAAENNTFMQIKNGHFHLLIAINGDQMAQGELIWDDGEAEHTNIPESQQKLFHAVINCAKQMCTIHAAQDNIPAQRKLLQSIAILLPLNERDSLPSTVLVNEAEVAFHAARMAGDGAVLLVNLADALDLGAAVRIVWRHNPIGEHSRSDCSPENNQISASDCAQRGCVHRPSSQLNAAAPSCYFDWHRPNSYTVAGCNSSPSGTTCRANKTDSFNIYKAGVSDLSIEMPQQLASGVARIKITDAAHDRYEVPISLNLQAAQAGTQPQLTISVANDDNQRLRVRVARAGSNQSIFDTSATGGFTFEDQFLQLAGQLPTDFVYGLGEHTHHNLRHRFDYSTWPMFSRDQPVGGHYGNFYGVHPLLIGKDSSGDCFGMFFLNSNAQEVQFIPRSSIAYRSIGGILDIFFMPGPTLALVISQYTHLVGVPSLPPYWSLGFHLCRYGYNSMSNLNATVTRNVLAGIPIDVQYADIDHMQGERIFTYDTVAFAGLPQFVRDIRHRYGIRFVYILDPTVITNLTEGTYPPYDDGLVADVFVKWPKGKNPDFDIYGNDNLLGYAWPQGRVVFPDFCSNRTSEYWQQQIQQYSDTLSFDGLWLDMNEPANFGTNEERPWNWPESARPYWSLKCDMGSELERPAYKTKTWGAWLSDKTICMSALHCDSKYRHYDLHSLYGQMQAAATDRAVKSVTGKRGLVISRATFPGDGKYGGTWLGDNFKSWGHMRDSIIGVVEHSMFGVPFVGADICGYFGDAVDVELCLRWSQLGAWYPYNRNHNGLYGKAQDPAVFTKRVTAAIRESLIDRYRLLPYLYTCMYLAMLKGEAPVRPLFHDFPNDPISWDTDLQMMWGPALMVAPNLFPNSVQTLMHLPPGKPWFDYYSGQELSPGTTQQSTPTDRIALAIAGGNVLAAYAGFERLYRGSDFFNTDALRNHSLHLIAALDQGNANGLLFVDDGDSINPSSSSHQLIELSITNNGRQLHMNWSQVFTGANPILQLKVDSVDLFGMLSHVSDCSVDGDCYLGEGSDAVRFRFDARMRILQINHLSLSLRSIVGGSCRLTLS